MHTGTESRRLAVVDLDWDHVRAVDIHAALRSFLPASGRIASVTVYPSDYGLQRMQEEAAHGPQVCSLGDQVTCHASSDYFPLRLSQCTSAPFFGTFPRLFNLAARIQGIYNPLENGHSNLGKQGGSRRHSKRDGDQANDEDQTDSEDAASDGSSHESDSQADEVRS